MPIGPDMDLEKLMRPATGGETLDQRKAKLKKATQAFESVFIGMMFKQVRKSMQGNNPFFGKSPESRLYQEMMDDTMSQRISESGSFGLGKTLYKRMESFLAPEEAAVREKVASKLAQSADIKSKRP